MRWMQWFIDKANKGFTLNRKNLKGGGLESMVTLAADERDRSVAAADFYKSYVILDRDRENLRNGELQRAIETASERNMILIWQRPCFEGALLRHFEITSNDTGGAKRIFREHFGKEAPLDIHALRRRLGTDSQLLRNAFPASCGLEDLARTVQLVVD